MKNYTMKRANVSKELNNNRGSYLSVQSGFHTLKDLDAWKEVLEYYDEYITDLEKVLDIFEKIETVSYINAGLHDDVDGWKHNLHLFTINGMLFEYKTGTGIKIDDNYYSMYKLLFDCVFCLMNEASYLQYYNNMDDFLHEFGYDTDIKQVRQGEKIYKQIQENKEKLLQIFDIDMINNIRDCIEL